MLKTEFIKTPCGYAWNGPNSKCCIVAKYYNTYIHTNDLYEVLDVLITPKELKAILKFDNMKGTKTDLKILKTLARRLNMELAQV